MKNKILFILVSILSITAYAQPQRKCGFGNVQQRLTQHPDYAKYDLEKKIVHKTARQNKMDTVIRIPVVVHVIYRLATENISTAQIQSQIAVLNKDYRKLNPDTTNAAGWSKADVKFEFILATLDPNGNPTSGITRTSTTRDDIGNTSQYYSLVPAWNNQRYLNIWVCDVGSDLLGFAFPPNSPGVTPQEDGIVIGSKYFGTVGTTSTPYNLGRTTTHEVAHYFDLLHIWGNDQNPSCNTDDLIADTPNQNAEVYSCAARTSCTSVDQLSNFLQYVDDACMGNFTLGQKTRMRTALYTQRDSLQYSASLGLTSISESNLLNETKIYPNPMSGNFFIELPENTIPNSIKVQIFDITGKEQNFKTKATVKGLQVELTNQKTGVYFLQLRNKNFSLTKKLIQH